MAKDKKRYQEEYLRPVLKGRGRGKVFLYIMILSVLGMEGFAATEGNTELPRLLVNISIDQLRTEEMQAFMPVYSDDGLLRLFTQGRVYTNVTHPYAPADRASATATLQTGTTPRYHGIVANDWIDRTTLRPINCTRAIKETDGSIITTAKALMASTIGDEIKINSNGAAIVYAIAAEEDGAVLSGGHCADAAIWFDRRNCKWTTSSYYATTTPMWMDSWNKVRQKLFKEMSKENNLEINSEITDIALQCQYSTKMGEDITTDYLSLQYYTDGTEEGYRALDGAIGKLIRNLERRLGKEHLLFVVTSTGYQDIENDYLDKYRIPSGTFYINRTAGYLNMYLAAIYGTGTYVDAYHENQIYLNHNILERKHIRLTEALEHCREMLLMSEGVQDAYTAPRLNDNADNNMKKLYEGCHRKVSGDIIVEVAPGWKVLNEDIKTYKQQHLSGYAFPVMVYGGNIEPETINTAYTSTQIAPAICRMIRIRAPNACKSTPLF